MHVIIKDEYWHNKIFSFGSRSFPLLAIGHERSRGRALYQFTLPEMPFFNFSTSSANANFESSEFIQWFVGNKTAKYEVITSISYANWKMATTYYINTYIFLSYYQRKLNRSLHEIDRMWSREAVMSRTFLLITLPILHGWKDFFQDYFLYLKPPAFVPTASPNNHSKVTISSESSISMGRS